MRKGYVFVLALMAIVIIIAMAVTRDPEQTPVDTTSMQAAEAEWAAMDPIAQDIICDMWNDGRLDDMTDFTEAKKTVTEKECEDHG
jgi:signal transduction histidine kinase